MSTGFAYKDLPPVLQCLSAGRGQGKTTCQRCLRIRLNGGKRDGWGSWVRLVLWQNQSPVLGLAVKGSPYIVYMPVQPNGKFCPKWPKEDFCQPEVLQWLLLVTPGLQHDLSTGLTSYSIAQRAILTLKVPPKLLISIFIPADAPHHYWWWSCKNCSQHCLL